MCVWCICGCTLGRHSSPHIYLRDPQTHSPRAFNYTSTIQQNALSRSPVADASHSHSHPIPLSIAHRSTLEQTNSHHTPTHIAFGPPHAKLKPTNVRRGTRSRSADGFAPLKHTHTHTYGFARISQKKTVIKKTKRVIIVRLFCVSHRVHAAPRGAHIASLHSIRASALEIPARIKHISYMYI